MNPHRPDPVPEPLNTLKVLDYLEHLNTRSPSSTIKSQEQSKNLRKKGLNP